MVRLSTSTSCSQLRPGSSGTTATFSTRSVGEVRMRGQAHGLLLLPPPPTPALPASLAVAYKPALRTILPQIAAHGQGGILDIALPLCPHADIYRLGPVSRGTEFSNVSALVNGIYHVVKNICLEHGIPDCGSNSIDIRVLLFRYDPQSKYNALLDASSPREEFDVVTDLPSLIKSQRQWTQLFVPNTEPALELFRQFRSIAAANLAKRVSRAQVLCTNPVIVPGGILLNQASTASGLNSNPVEPDQPFHRIVAVGEFTRLDLTTKALLTMAAFLLGGSDDRLGSLSGESSSSTSANDHLSPYNERSLSISTTTSSRHTPALSWRARHRRQLVLRPATSSSGSAASTGSSSHSDSRRARSVSRLGRRPRLTETPPHTAGAEFWYDRILHFLEAIGNCEASASSLSSLGAESASTSTSATSSPIDGPARPPFLSSSPLGLVHARKDGTHHLEAFGRTSSTLRRDGSMMREYQFEVVDEISNGSRSDSFRSRKKVSIDEQGEGTVMLRPAGESESRREAKEKKTRGRSDSGVGGFIRDLTSRLSSRTRDSSEDEEKLAAIVLRTQ